MENRKYVSITEEIANFRKKEKDALVESTSINPKDKIAKEENRVAFHTVPPIAKVYLALAMMEGEKKYGWFNWRKIPIDEKVYTDAAERHLTALQDGEWIDRNSGLPHAAKVMACMSILLDNYYRDPPHFSLTAADLIWEQGHKKNV